MKVVVNPDAGMYCDRRIGRHVAIDGVTKAPARRNRHTGTSRGSDTGSHIYENVR